MYQASSGSCCLWMQTGIIFRNVWELCAHQLRSEWQARGGIKLAYLSCDRISVSTCGERDNDRVRARSNLMGGSEFSNGNNGQTPRPNLYLAAARPSQ